MAPALRKRSTPACRWSPSTAASTAWTGIIAHVGADNVKGGEAQGEWMLKNYPNGATLINLQGQPGASPAIDRNKGLHNVLDTAQGQVQDRLSSRPPTSTATRPDGDREPALPA